MKIFKENPFLLCWLIFLTILGIYHFLPIDVNVRVKIHAPEGVRVGETHEVKILKP
jgi:hypothetical protein